MRNCISSTDCLAGKELIHTLPAGTCNSTDNPHPSLEHSTILPCKSPLPLNKHHCGPDSSHSPWCSCSGNFICTVNGTTKRKDFFRMAIFPGDLCPVFVLDYAGLCNMVTAPTNALTPQEDCKKTEYCTTPPINLDHKQYTQT